MWLHKTQLIFDIKIRKKSILSKKSKKKINILNRMSKMAKNNDLCLQKSK